MGPRVKLTGIGDSGPVWVWVAHVSSVFTLGQTTAISLVGIREPHGVAESVDQVLDMLDAAAGGVDREGGV